MLKRTFCSYRRPELSGQCSNQAVHNCSSQKSEGPSGEDVVPSLAPFGKSSRVAYTPTNINTIKGFHLKAEL